MPIVKLLTLNFGYHSNTHIWINVANAIKHIVQQQINLSQFNIKLDDNVLMNKYEEYIFK